VYRFERYGELVAELSAAAEGVFERFGLNPYSPLSVYATLDCISSPLKAQYHGGGPLADIVGRVGIRAFYASMVAREVECIKAQHSLTVNPIMEIVVFVLASAGQSLPEAKLFKSVSDLSDSSFNEAGLRSGFESALRYLREGQIITHDPDSAWRLAESLQWDFNAAVAEDANLS
jgi:hypothetical protein